jgi:hypothetical protein
MKRAPRNGPFSPWRPGAKPQQFGLAEAANDRWSIKSPLGQDGGSYTLVDEDTLQLTGMLGTGLWKRVWAPRDRTEQRRSSASERSWYDR